MKFSEAVAALEEGKKVRTVDAPEHGYLVLNGGVICTHLGQEWELHARSPKSDWEVYEEPGHDFTWALKQFKNGRKVRRRSWAPKFGIHMRSDAADTTSSMQDMVATDWELA